eukprot:GFUD01105769.1.p1 GENE.GFUD01105769.1~~GFUD01105769.1.p1  ORF type:complete len:310 (+),score=128.72 GFUD01105769.1:78-1007(+)
MSFSFSQSLLGNISSYPGPLSQEMEDSQDSGYAVHSTYLPCPPSVPTYPPSVRLPFPPRRTLPLPPTWSNQDQPQQGGSRWKFGGRTEWGGLEGGKNTLERDLQQHLAEIFGQVNIMNEKVATIVEESVKYMQKVYGKETVSVRQEVELVNQVVEKMKEQVVTDVTRPGEMMERLAVLETGLAVCAAWAETVTDTGKRIEDKLTGLQHKLGIVVTISNKMVDEVSSISSNTMNINTMNNMVRNMKPVPSYRDVSPPPSPTRQVLTKPLPSIRRLPIVPLLSAATSLHQGGVETVKKTQNLGDFGRREDV